MKYRQRGKKLVADAHPMTGEKCPVLTVKVTKGPDQVQIEAKHGRKQVGGIILQKYGRGDESYVQVLSIGVDETVQRCGLGTRLYEMAATEACKADLPLRSDTFRSMCSQDFWEKQTRKGRARCLGPENPQAHSSFYPTRGFPCGAPVKGRGGCKQYELETCSKDLTGLPRKRKRAR